MTHIDTTVNTAYNDWQGDYGMKVCCVAGHRDIPENQMEAVKTELRRAIMQAVSEGYYTFISGFTRGTGLIVAGIVAELKAVCRVRLVAAIPYYGRLTSKDPEFWRLLRQCDAVEVVTGKYNARCYDDRDRFMVDSAARLIVLYDGRENGGTYATLKYAREREREIRIISLGNARPCA